MKILFKSVCLLFNKTCLQKHKIEIYTDGSCHTQQRVGAWAALIFIDKEKTTLTGCENHTTHNRMELLAVINAIKWLEEHDLVKETIHIFSDSQYVINLNNRAKKLSAKEFLTNKGTAIKNEDLVKEILSFYGSYDINLVKVKAHQKSDGTQNFNREVDMIVRKLVRGNIKQNGR